MSLIKDSIHRFIKIPALCKEFIDTPEFNRLRKIKQLGLCYFVFPTANHTRFEHSLGVMEIAGKVIDVINSMTEYKVTEREKELVQLAGLLHDSGHVSFSHLFDYILEEKLQERKGDNKKEWEYMSCHENRSVFILKKINIEKKLLDEKEIEMVKRMIKGEVRETDEKPFLYEIVCNKRFGLDVDRLDYLQRDMYYTGMPCFQADYIINCIRVKDGRLCVSKKAKSEIEMLYEARRRELTLVCRHKTVVKIERIVRECIEMLEICDDWFLENWLKLDDYRVWSMFEDNCPELLEKIYRRDWSDIEISPNESSEHLVSITRDQINEQLNKVLYM